MNGSGRADLTSAIRGVANQLSRASTEPELVHRIQSCVELIEAGEEGVALEILLSNLFELDVSLTAAEATRFMLAAEELGIGSEEVDSLTVRDAAVPIGLFRKAIRRRADRWGRESVAWKLTLGQASPKPSAWLDLKTARGDGQMILWTSGEVELIWGCAPSWEAVEEHREVSTELGLEICLNDLEGAVIGHH